MNKYKITLEYDGTNYVGWQKQANGISIQACLEKAIEKKALQTKNVKKLMTSDDAYSPEKRMIKISGL